MPSKLTPQRLHRYRDIAKLFIKYGRGDLAKSAGIGDGAEEIAAAEPEATAPSDPLVHERAGEVLVRQRRKRVQASAGAAGTAVEDERETPSDRAAELADDLEAMGPTFVKVGQFLSTRADLLPQIYLEALARLQDRVAPFPFADVERIVSEELGVRLSKAFETFEDIPVAAASLGQVHRAVLRSGELVAVKVQRPDIRERAFEDLEVLAEIAGLLDQHTEIGKRQQFVPMLEEFRKSLLNELDYRQEARNLSVVGENLAGIRRVVVPSPVEDYVTSRVLTMEFVQGRKVTSLGPLAKMEIDGAPLAEDLCRAYLQQILVDGFFHADPHPGNVFVTDDGRIALLDLGMVAQISPGMQEELLKLVLAISEGQGEEAGAIVTRIGTPVGEADRAGVQRTVAERVMQFQGVRVKDLALGRLMFDAARIASECGYRMPRELTMLSKALLNVDEVARTLDPEFDPNASIRRNASEIMRRRMIKSLSPGRMFAGLLEMKELTEKLPRRLNQLFEAVAENRVRVKVDTINEVLLMEGLQKIANRITLGLVISALIVGAALLMRIETRFTLFGYPGLAILFFMAAAITGCVLAFNILLHDLRAGKKELRKRESGDAAPRAS